MFSGGAGPDYCRSNVITILPASAIQSEATEIAMAADFINYTFTGFVYDEKFLPEYDRQLW